MCIMYVMCKYIFCRHMFLYYVVHMPIRPMFWCSGQTRLVWHIPNQGWPHSRAGHLCDWPEGGCISIRTPTWHSRGNAFVDCRIFFRLKVNVFLKLFLEGGELASEAEREKYAKLMLLICTDGVAWQSFWTAALGFSCNRALGSSSSLQEVCNFVPLPAMAILRFGSSFWVRRCNLSKSSMSSVAWIHSLFLSCMSWTCFQAINMVQKFTDCQQARTSGRQPCCKLTQQAFFHIQAKTNQD